MVDQAFRTCVLIMGSAVLLVSCAASSDRYPSLATRDVERVQGMFEPVNPVPQEPAAAPQGQADRLASLTAQASSAHDRFLSAVPGARDLVSAVSDVGPESNAWASAQVALADLESLRSQAAIALGDLDLLYAEATTGFVEREVIAQARDEVIGNIAAEDAILAELRAKADQ